MAILTALMVFTWLGEGVTWLGYWPNSVTDRARTRADTRRLVVRGRLLLVLMLTCPSDGVKLILIIRFCTQRWYATQPIGPLNE